MDPGRDIPDDIGDLPNTQTGYYHEVELDDLKIPPERGDKQLHFVAYLSKTSLLVGYSYEKKTDEEITRSFEILGYDVTRSDTKDRTTWTLALPISDPDFELRLRWLGKTHRMLLSRSKAEDKTNRKSIIEIWDTTGRNITHEKLEGEYELGKKGDGFTVATRADLNAPLTQKRLWTGKDLRPVPEGKSTKKADGSTSSN